jgi:hypothetical protein
LRLAAVEDVTNSLDVWTFQTGGKSSSHDDIAAPGAPAPAVLASTGSQSPAGTSVAPMASQASSLPQAPAALMGTTDSSDGTQATSRHHKRASHVSLARGVHGHSSGLLVGRSHPRGHKNHHVGAAGHSTNNPVSWPGY